MERIAALALAILALYLAATEDLAWVPILIGGIAAVALLLVDWPYGAFLELCVAASMPRWFVKIGKLHAKPEHFVAAVIGVFLFSRILTQKHKWKSAGKPELVLLAFLAMNYFTSLTTSPDRASTLRWAVLLTMVVSPFFMIWQVVRTREELDRFMDRWLLVGALGALFGILCFFSFVAFHTEFGVSVFDFLGFIPAVHGAQWEPNIFGSYCASFSAMFLFYFLNCTGKKGWYLAGFLITTVALLLSLARQGWLSLVIVGASTLFYTFRRTKFRVKHLAPVLASIIIAFVVGFAVMGNLSDRLASLSLDTAEDDPTVVRRAGMMALASQDVQAHPLLGLGTSSFQLLYIADSDTTYQGVDNAWLGSYFFGIVHDIGAIGMMVFLWFLIGLGRRAWRVLAAPARGPTTTAVGALCAAVMVMLIAYQFTDASTLAFTWIHYGMLAAALRIAELPGENI
ncbi:MAG: O-antigen ligase family protein [Candidatus Sulfotelmatobacter sp.]